MTAARAVASMLDALGKMLFEVQVGRKVKRYLDEARPGQSVETCSYNT